MNSQTYQSPAHESQVKKAVQRTPQPTAFDPLSWVQVIQHPDRDLQELDFEQEVSTAFGESAAYLHAE